MARCNGCGKWMGAFETATYCDDCREDSSNQCCSVCGKRDDGHRSECTCETNNYDPDFD